MRFDDAEQHERSERTRSTIAKGATMVGRWRDLTTTQTATWDHPARAAARLLTGCARVVDIGCGRMTLEPHLPPGTLYLPMDVVRRDPRTRIADLNREPLDWPAGADAAAMLGLLEYIHDVPALLTQLPAGCSTLVVSYCTAELTPGIEERLANGWVNAFSAAEVEGLFAPHGWRIARREQVDAMQWLWHLVRAPARGIGPDILFIGGTGRSGTSSIQEIVTHAPGFAPVWDYETKFITGPGGLIDLWQAYTRPVTFPDLEIRLDTFCAFVRGHGAVFPHFATSRAVETLGAEVVDAALHAFYRDLLKAGPDVAERRATMRAAAADFLATLFDATRKSVIVEKTPDNALALASLAEIFPEAHFIISLRDPGATLDSFLRQEWNTHDAAVVSDSLLLTYRKLLDDFTADPGRMPGTYLLDIDDLAAGWVWLESWLANRLNRPVALAEANRIEIEARVAAVAGRTEARGSALLAPLIGAAPAAHVTTAFARLRALMPYTADFAGRAPPANNPRLTIPATPITAQSPDMPVENPMATAAVRQRDLTDVVEMLAARTVETDLAVAGLRHTIVAQSAHIRDLEQQAARLVAQLAELETRLLPGVGPVPHRRGAGQSWRQLRQWLGRTWLRLRHPAKFRRKADIALLRHNGLMDADWYLGQYPDVAINGMDPVAHYVRFGADEGRNPSPRFETSAYRRRKQLKPGVNPLAHHIRRSRDCLAGDPALFDAGFYLAANPDVRAEGVDALDHFLRYGIHEGRRPSRTLTADDVARRLKWTTSGA